MSVSLYRKYRPQNFSSVAGQSSAIEVITNSILKNRTGHAYLFSGSRGCGKTSVARIFAKALNCLERDGFEPCGKCQNCIEITKGESLDVIEIDGASNNGVESIRSLKENVTLAPFNSQYKIYIIDEVHMLSTGAFNALLKTLEEPPENVVFILATTEPHKIPVTIRSRCQHIPFHSISPEDIFVRLKEVCRLEGIDAEDDAIREISRLADGALRDALSLLEQIIASGNITLKTVEAIFGAGSRPAFERWIKNLRENPELAYTSLKSMLDAGASSVRVFEELFLLVKNLWLVSQWKNIADALNLSKAEKNFLIEEAPNWKKEKLHYLAHLILKVIKQAKLGVRNDILMGMLIMYINNVPPRTKIVDTPSFTKPPEFSASKEAKNEFQEANKKKFNVIEGDLALKETLLQKAREKSFVIYCGLFDANFYVDKNTLFLVFEHAYCYEVLRVDRTAATIKAIFNTYEHVILRYGKKECYCPDFPASQNQATRTPTIPYMPTEALRNQPKKNETQSPEKNKVSPFDNLIYKLASLGAKPEKLFTRYIIQQEEQVNEQDIDNENSEGENDL